ncbi:MAG: putative Transposon Ty3-I Gag-Pol polyprotein [Streblomastix strix]|uniref:Putative Transposon Ty3-I Gag-Pol polyprotein n=1 Tax=Streblomastix strix TaxID=222440 RepID=A0A5J4X1Q1_9EUKA|nr:MAG: putative Transposon Ty3-I Gag-Pol polyprotein [Streblomastix strix]
MAYADVDLDALTGGATIKDSSLEKLNPKMQAYKAMLEEELQERIIDEIPKEKVKWWILTFLVPRPSGEWRKILDASLLNEEIQPLHFQKNGVEQIRCLLIPNDWAVKLDLKSASHHLIVYPPHREYLVFEVDNHHYQYWAMPFGFKHSPIFFTQALTLLLTEIRKRTDIRIINYSDDLLLLHQDKNWLFYQTPHIINTLEHFGWTIALNKWQLIPIQEIDFLGWTWNMTEMNIFMTKDRRHQLLEQIKQFVKNAQRHKIIKIKETAALIGRLNFLRTQFGEASLYLMQIDSAKTRAVKTQGWTGMMVSPLEALKELYWWIKKITENKKIYIQPPIPQATAVTDASPQGWGATLELNSGEVLVAHGAWLSYQIHWTSNNKELQAIHLEIIAFARICKELQIINLLIRSDNSTAVFDLRRLRATDTLTPAVKDIYFTCQHLNMKIISQHVSGKKNIIADALSRLYRLGDYHFRPLYLDQIIMILNILPTLDLFASSTTKLLQHYVTANIGDQNAQWIDAFSNTWTNKILLVHTPIPIFSKVISYLNNEATLAMIIAPLWPGKPWFTSLMNQSSKYLIFVQSSQCLIKGLSMENPKSFLPPGKIAAFFMDQKGAQQLLINVWRFETQRHYLYAMRTLAEFSYEHGLSIDQLLSISPGFLLFEVINWFTRWNPSASSAYTLQQCLNTMLSFIFDIPQITQTPSKLPYRAVLNYKIINRRYSNMWDIRQLFDYWRSRPDDKDLSNTEIQTKLALLLLSICFIIINEVTEINLAISNIDYRNQTAILCLVPKANNSIEQYEIRRTGDPKVSLNSTLFTWLNRLYWHFGMDAEHFANFFWQPDGQPADKRRISLWLNSLLREIGIRGATAYSFKHAASTELARQGLDTTKLNIFTHHSVFSRAASNYYIYAANAGIYDIASQLVGSHGQSYATQTISQQRGGAIERSDISTLPEYFLQHSDNSKLSRSSIAQPLALPFYETLPVGRGIEPTDNKGALNDIIYLDQHNSDDMSRQQDYWSSWNANEFEHRRSFDKDLQQQ